MAREGPDPAAAPHGEAAPPPSRRVEELEARLRELETRLEERTQALARLQSEYKSHKDRARRKREEARRGGRVELVSALADVLDDVDRALDADPSEDVRKGLQLVVRRIEDQLASIDAERVQPEPGEAFDPERHEALTTEATDEHEEDTVLELLQPGYALGDHLVRAARVKVAKPPDD